MPGEDFTIVIFSIDSTETPAEAQKAMERLADLGIPQSAWEDAHFAHSACRHDRIWLQKRASHARNYPPAAVAFISPKPENMVSRYLYGFDFQLSQLRNTINEASVGGVGTKS